jgi:hypothetical protein
MASDANRGTANFPVVPLLQRPRYMDPYDLYDMDKADNEETEETEKDVWLGCRVRVTLVCFAMVAVYVLTTILLTGSGVFVTSYNMLLALVAQDIP